MKGVVPGGLQAAPRRSLATLRSGLAGAGQTGAEIYVFGSRELRLRGYVPGGSSVPAAAVLLLEAAGPYDAMIWGSRLHPCPVSGNFASVLDGIHLLADYLPDHVVGRGAPQAPPNVDRP